MATAATKLLTAEEYFDWANSPENRDKYCELVRGEIVEMSRPGRRHGFVCANVVWILGQFVRQRRKGYICSNDTGVVTEHDPDTVRGPDVMLFEDAEHYEDLDLKYGEHPPLLAVEVLSPNDVPGKVNQRVVEQLAFGTRLVWVVDPEACNITVYRPGKQPDVVSEGQELTGEDVLPDFRCQVEEFFALPGSAPRSSKPSRSPKRKPPRRPKK
jgi:Uma2 family endonuclease